MSFEENSMSKKMERPLQSLAGGLIITLSSPIFGLPAWPLLIFDRLFPPECTPEELACLFSGKAILATLVSEVLIYSLLTYLVLRWKLIYIKRTSYIGDV
jgi:hypothetical protein